MNNFKAGDRVKVLSVDSPARGRTARVERFQPDGFVYVLLEDVKPDDIPGNWLSPSRFYLPHELELLDPIQCEEVHS